MTFSWSAHAPHIQSLFAPWQQGDGYAEGHITATEVRLLLRLPALLRAFWRSWGTRFAMTQQVQRLLPPEKVFVQSHTLVFCVENQGVLYWGIPVATLSNPNPPVCVASNEGSDLTWQASHDSLSDFLDYLIYSHALAEGALCGAYAQNWTHKQTDRLLEQQYTKVLLPSYPHGFIPNLDLRPWSLFMREGLVIDTIGRVAVASRTVSVVDKIAEQCGLTWVHRWGDA